MKKTSILLVLAIMLFACNSNPNDKNLKKPDIKDTLINENIIIKDVVEKEVIVKNPRTDEYVQFYENQDISDSINAWLFAEDINFLLDANEMFENIETAEQLADFYNITIPKTQKIIYAGIQISNPEVVYAGDSAPVDSWLFLQDYLLFIGVDLMCSECGAEVLTNIYEFKYKAEETSDSIDNMFFETLELIYYEDWNETATLWDGGGNSGNWHTMDGCDFCSYSNLGTFKIFDILYAIQRVQELTDLFDKTLNWLKSNTLMYCNYNYYAGSREDVLEEINLILEKIKLTDEEKQEVMNAKINWESDNDLQFDCQDGSCEYDY